ncbi:lamin tail domain-containing protein [Methylomonas sp. MED-D]|uniref:lamin tail domain-containing protein n=1 Tax=unclassified Methylomonas TaxID=2608980 RepID=UPI0028A3F5C4|nr:lamin tail domain-containing protein [Methylomonas sp. MV1]MDT4332758.1 lamin tail domain-containing protein [Methylomonas sp. MV1]
MSVKKFRRAAAFGIFAASSLFAATASASTVAVTEWMYNGDEFIEFTNLTNAAVDFSGWSYDDDSRSPGTVSLSAFGLVAAGESVILAENDAATFRSHWNLSASVKIIGGNTVNLGRNDEINLYNAANMLIDRLSYGDGNLPGTIRTQNISGNPGNLAVLDQDNVTSDWVLSSVGDSFGSIASVSGEFVANPGRFALAPAAVPVPAAFPLMLSGLALSSIGRKKRA